MFFNKGYTGIKVLVTSFINTCNVKKVYDLGNGPFVYEYSGNTPRYLMDNGTFENPTYRTCNGDPQSWRIHEGDISDLKFKNSSTL